MARSYSNLYAGGTLAAALNSSAMTVQVSSAAGLPNTFPYTLVIDEGTPSMEVVEVTAASGGTLSVLRGVDGTSAVTHSLGAPVSHSHSARDFRECQLHLDSTTAHGATGAVVGTTNTQTISNKAISVGLNTVNGFTASRFVTSDGTGRAVGTQSKTIPAGTVVGTSDAQLLTNKTLTSPVIDGTVDLKGQVSSSSGAVEVNDALTVTGLLTSSGFKVPHIQTGTLTVNVTASTFGSALLTFPTPFPSAPNVFVNVAGSSAYLATCNTAASTSSVTVGVRHVNDAAQTVSLTVMWMAVYMP